jgi:hypothetical protein
MKKLADDGNSLFRKLPILLTNVSYYFVLRYLTADAERVLCIILGVNGDYFLKRRQHLIAVMVKGGVLFEVCTEFLNVI